MNEIKGQFNDVLVVTELRGSAPDVPFFDDVDIAELTKNDPEPMYLTIAIGKANVISENKRFYDEAWLQELERQVKSVRPIGIMGHLAENELATKFPDEAIHWLGVRRIGEMLFGKGYVPAGAARERIRKYKATNKAIGTSIFAIAEGIWNQARGAYDMLANTLKLQQIDIGPADRIGIAALASVPMLTAEMQEEVIEPEQELVMDKLEILNALTSEDVRLLPKAVRDAILAEVPTAPEVAQVTEMRKALGVDDKADLARVVTEMRQAQETQRLATIRNKITELATSGIKIDAVRGLVTELVAARNPQSVADVETAYQEVSTSAHVTELLKATVQSVMGPPQRTPLQMQQGQNKFFVIPTDEKERA